MDRFSILVGDITQSDAEAIVNAADPSLLGGAGVDGAIHAAAGPELLAECRTLGGCERGQAKLTAGYRLRAKYVIHTPGPIWHGGDRGEPALLASCYRSCLELARQNQIGSVAFCCISTGEFHFPNQRAAEIAIQTVRQYQKRTNSGMKVIFNVFKTADWDIYRKLLGADPKAEK